MKLGRNGANRWRTLFNRREIYDAVVPEEVLVLTAGVDVQDDRFEVEIVGWGVGKESWGIRYQKIYGDMLKEQVWEDLDAFLQTVWCKKDGTALRIISCCIDSGGHHTDQVYRFTKERYERGVWAIKGKGGAEVPYIRNPTTNNRVKTPLFIIGVDAGKVLLYQRLRHNTKGPNYCHFPANEEAGYDETYFKGLTSEKMVVRFRKGRSVTVWELKDSKYKRNEPLDLRNYATAALEIANPVLAKPEPGMAQSPRGQAAAALQEVFNGYFFKRNVPAEIEYMACGGGKCSHRAKLSNRNKNVDAGRPETNPRGNGILGTKIIRGGGRGKERRTQPPVPLCCP